MFSHEQDSTLPLATEADPAGDWLGKVAILVGLGLICWATFSQESFQPLWTAALEHRWSRLLARPSLLWSAMGALLLCLRTLLWFRYRPAAPLELSAAPTLSVIIPAYNEGAMVERSIDSVAAANYPPEKLEIFVIDDGSTDDTWHYVERAVRRHPGRITALRLEKNQGKRAALAEGFRRAAGELLVTIDSDSIIEPGALLAIASPFRNPRVGAVAGKVAVLNREGWIPRMLAVRFVLTFDFLRAAQSTYGTVYCCPGALTAYRSRVVRPLVDRWLAQTFLGAPCTYGEDRAMTNLILAERFDAVYQRNAVVRTVVPTSYVRLCKMFLRWERSYVREEARYLTILWSRPAGARLISFFETLLNNLRFFVIWASMALLVGLVPGHPLVMLRLFFAIGLFAAFNMLYYLHSERSMDFLYGILFAYFSFFCLFWIFPYAVVSVRARGWLTR